MKKVIFWIYEFALLSLAICYLTGEHAVEREEAYYNSLADEAKLSYIVNTYYDDINNYLEIDSDKRLESSCVSIQEELAHEQAVGTYQPEEQKIIIRTDKIQEGLGASIQVLAHELTHHRQYIEDQQMVDIYLDTHAGDPGYEDITFEQDSEFNAHMYVASKGFDYYNGRGCTYEQWYPKYILGASRRGAGIIIQSLSNHLKSFCNILTMPY